MGAFRLVFNTEEVKDFFVQSAKNTRSVNEAISRDFRPLMDSAVADLQDAIIDQMRAAGLKSRTGFMESNTRVTMVSERITSDGVEWEISVDAPIRAFAHEEGAVITPGSGKSYLPIPFLDGRSSGDEHELEEDYSDETSEDRRVRIVQENLRTAGFGDSRLDMADVRSGKATFTLFKGKGKRVLKIPIMVARLEQRVKKSKRESRADAMTDAWLAANHPKENLSRPFVPLYSMRKVVVIPRRPWLAPAVAKMHTKMSAALKSASARYTSGEGFMFNVVPRMSKL